jgi:putative hemolysin
MSRATPPERSVSSLPPKYRLRHLRRILRTVFAAAVFLCTLSKEPDQIANPAFEFCIDQGDTLDIRKDSSRGEIAYCEFDDGTECEE